MRSIYGIVPAPIAHWKMNDDAASAVVLDAMGNYDGTYKDKDGDLDTDTGHSTGKIGGALDFDGPQGDGGTDEYVDTGDTFQSTFQGSFSISLCCKPTDGQPASTGYLFGVSTASPLENDCVWMVIGNTGSLVFQYSSNGNRGRLYVNGGVALFSDGQQDWHHLVMVVDSTIRAVGGVKGYFDGVLQPLHDILSRGDTTNVVSADFTLINNPLIGAENVDGPTGYYNGLIDNVIIFNKALTARQVKRLYDFRVKESIFCPNPNRIYNKNMINNAIYGGVNG